jgi:hypothetical protein
MPFNKEQKNFIKNNYSEIQQMELNDENWIKFSTNIINEINNIDKIIREELELWINNKNVIKLIILAEAPLSFNKYFYNKPGNFLNGLKDYYKTDNSNLKRILREKGIFIVESYKFPIKTKYYDIKGGSILFEDSFLNDRFDLLRHSKLIDTETKIVFRYKKLFKRNCITLNSNISSSLLSASPVSLYKNGERGKVQLSDEVIKFLKNKL